MDIHSNASGAEFQAFGGVGRIDQEVLDVLKTNRLFVVPPPMKR
jgi:hypothetical protein